MTAKESESWRCPDLVPNIRVRDLAKKPSCSCSTRWVLLLSGTGTIGLNISLNFFNDWALKPTQLPGFDFPLFYTMWQMAATLIGTCIIQCIWTPAGGIPFLQEFWQYKYLLIANSLCTSLDIGFNNLSLTLISLFVNQIIKAFGLAPGMLFSTLLEGRRHGCYVLLSCAVIICGTALAVPDDMSSTAPTFSNSGTGVVVVVVVMLANGLKPVLVSLVMTGWAGRPGLPPTVVLFYDSLLSFFFLLFYWLLADERNRSLDYFNVHATWGVGILILGSTMAFIYNLSNYWYVHSTSSVTSLVTSNGTRVVILFIAAVQSNIQETRNWVGIGVATIGLIAYAGVVQDDEWKKGDEPLQRAPDPELAKRMLNEATPLNTSPTPVSVDLCCILQ